MSEQFMKEKSHMVATFVMKTYQESILKKTHTVLTVISILDTKNILYVTLKGLMKENPV